MFYGEFVHNLDKKNRLIVPARFRASITDNGIEKLYVTRGLDKCLFIFTDEEWAKQETRFNAMPFTKKQVRQFKRMFFSGAAETTPDKQWRILLPEYLKDYAGLSRNVMVIGVGNRIEIWDKEKWDEYYEGSKEDYETIAEDLIDV